VAPLVFSAICSLDGYVVDADGSFAWAAPDEEVHAHVNDHERDVETLLLGRRMYEVLSYWGSPDDEADREPIMRDYRQIWQATEKVVYSSTLREPATARTVVRERFDVDEVRRLLESADRPVSIGGPTLAAEGFRAGLVDEVRLYRHPVLVGGGTPALPDGLRLDLELVETRAFASGVTYTHHRVRR
jgi:dihydrofolate reductase